MADRDERVGVEDRARWRSDAAAAGDGAVVVVEVDDPVGMEVVEFGVEPVGCDVEAAGEGPDGEFGLGLAEFGGDDAEQFVGVPAEVLAPDSTGVLAVERPGLLGERRGAVEVVGGRTVRVGLGGEPVRVVAVGEFDGDVVDEFALMRVRRCVRRWW